MRVGPGKKGVRSIGITACGPRRGQGRAVYNYAQYLYLPQRRAVMGSHLDRLRVQGTAIGSPLSPNQVVSASLRRGSLHG